MAAQRWHRFELRGVAGSGSFAVTYLAHDENGAEVALKVLAPNWANDLDVLHRFQAECDMLATAASTLDPADRRRILAFRDAGLDPEPWLAMEFCHGGSLADRMGENWRHLPLEARIGMTAWVGRSAASALAVVHDQLGIVHRDLSPSNLLMRSPDVTELVLGDFGLMKQAALQSNFSRVVGTERYASPEVRATGTCDHRSDLYSLGVICLEMLSTDVEDPPLDSLSSKDMPAEVPAELQRLITSLVAVERDDRPSSAIEVVAGFEPFATVAPPAVPLRLGELRRLGVGSPSRWPRRIVPAMVGLVAIATIAGALALRSDNTERAASNTPTTAAGNAATDTSTTVVGTSTVLAVTTEVDAAAAVDRRVADPRSGFALRLPADWIDEPLDDDSPLVLAALSETSSMLVVVGAVPSDINSAVQTTVRVRPEMQVVANDSDDDGRAWLELTTPPDTAEPRTEIHHFIPQSCGAYSLAFTKLGELTDADRSMIDAIAKSVELSSPTLLPLTPTERPPGYEAFDRYDAGPFEVLMPPAFVLADSTEKCFFAFESAVDSGASSASVSVTFFPALPSGVAGETVVEVWQGLGYRLVDEGAALNAVTGESVDRRHLRSSDEGELVAWLYERSGGTYSVEVVEGPRQASADGRLELFDQIAGGLRFASDA